MHVFAQAVSALLSVYVVGNLGLASSPKLLAIALHNFVEVTLRYLNGALFLTFILADELVNVG